MTNKKFETVAVPLDQWETHCETIDRYKQCVIDVVADKKGELVMFSEHKKAVDVMRRDLDRRTEMCRALAAEVESLKAENAELKKGKRRLQRMEYDMYMENIKSKIGVPNELLGDSVGGSCSEIEARLPLLHGRPAPPAGSYVWVSDKASKEPVRHKVMGYYAVGRAGMPDILANLMDASGNTVLRPLCDLMPDQEK